MKYDVVAGAIPTMTLTIEMPWVGVVLGLVVLVGFAMLAWHASADWRASITPVWYRTRWQEFLGINDVNQFKARRSERGDLGI